MDSERHALCGRSELEYSPAKLIQNEIDYAYTTEVNPQNSIVQGNDIKFHIAKTRARWWCESQNKEITLSQAVDVQTIVAFNVDHI